VGCILVRDRRHILDTFSHRPPYYHLDGDEELLNYSEYGPQNTRGFRALKVRLGLRQAGREGYAAMITRNIELAQALHAQGRTTPDLEAWTRGLSITTFRYVPTDLTPGDEAVDTYLNALNAAIVARLQQGGDVFLSNAVVRGTYLLRTCWANFRPTTKDIEMIPDLVRRVGSAIDRERRATL
jgi:glutamate/tyrosine decarboxylase-like PLP-dependent enzyme